MAFNTIDETGPVGLLHGDLFKDNTLFDGAVLKGVIDFYFAHHGPCLYDMAIALNDWATTSVGKIHERRYHAFLSGYESIRPLSTTEFALLTRYQCQAALRFWLSRLEAKYLPDAGQLPIRDPDMMASRLTHLLKSLN
jgi:homoserine kinase type II